MFLYGFLFASNYFALQTGYGLTITINSIECNCPVLSLGRLCFGRRRKLKTSRYVSGSFALSYPFVNSKLLITYDWVTYNAELLDL